MKRNQFLQSLLVLGTLPYGLQAKPGGYMKANDSICLLRHATVLLKLGKLTILIDPMLSAKNEMDPVPNCGNDTRIPMVDLPVDKEALNKMIGEAAAVVITHTHRDHWDAAAQQLVAKDKLIFCQPADAEKIRNQGFNNVEAIVHQKEWEGITISRTGGRHGTGEIGQKMGEVSGFVFRSNKKSIYVAGDTIWCDEVKTALDTHMPDYTILNAGGARFLTGDPITMTPQDIISVHMHLPATKIIAVHMDTINHCFVKRADLKKILVENNLPDRVMLPLDGETINL